MAFVYKPKRNGIPTAKWYARYYDACVGKWRSQAGYVDKRATLEKARRLERDSARRREGLPVQGEPSGVVLSELIEEFRQTLQRRGLSARWPVELCRRLETVAAALGWQSARDLAGPGAAAALSRWLHQQRTDRPRFGARTSNAFLKACRQFAGWLVKGGQIAANPFVDLPALNERTDPRHERRILTPDEFRRLVAAAEASPQLVCCLTGAQRAVLYVVAGYTGLRASELAALTPESFRLTGKPPAVVLPALADKSKRGAVLPLHREVVKRLKVYVKGVGITDSLWPGKWARDRSAAPMIRHDLAAAGIAYRDGAGKVFDFHALRRYAITQLALAGVPLAVAQKLARHSTPHLTASVYTTVGDVDLAAAVNKLPDV